jgi:parallel beta-helix repeat protein
MAFNLQIKFMSVRILFFILTLVSGISANAANYYFSTSDGDDSRSLFQAQNPSTPWQSIDKLNSFFPSLQPGDQVLFKSGDTFYGSIVVAQSGTSSDPITLSSYGSGSKPVISGLTTVTGWNYIGNGIYESDVLPTGTQLNMLLINGKQYAMGRYPNVSDKNGGYLTFQSFGNDWIRDDRNILTPRWKGAQLVVRTTHYTMERSVITKTSGNAISYSPSFKYGLTGNFGYFVQNSIRTLDQFGEWYYNPTTRKVDVFFGSSDPSGSTVLAATKDILLTIQRSYIVVDNLAIRGANTYGIYGDWAGVSNLQVKNCSIDLSGIDGICLANRHDFVLDNTTITNSNSVGVSLCYKNYNPVVKNCTIRNVGTSASMLQGDPVGRYGFGIFSTEGLTATNNKIINIGYIGIMFVGDNNLIQNNYIDTFCTVLDDGGGLYTGNYTPKGQQPTPLYNLKIIGNIVLHGFANRSGTYEPDPNYIPAEGIYLDDNAMSVQVLNNTIAYCANTGIYVHNTKNYTLMGNILFDNKYRQLALQHDDQGDVVTGGVIKYNQFFAQSAPEYVLHLGSVYNDISGFGTFDSNYYCRPSNENNIIYTNWFGNRQTWYNLPGWQSAFNQDQHTGKTPVPVTDPNNVLFRYNASTSDTTIQLNGTYVSVAGDSYSGSVTLAPFTSIILLKTSSSVTSSMNASAAAVTNTAAKGPGYVNTEPAKLTVKAYPNPGSKYFNVTVQGGSTSETMTLRILDLSGRILQVKTGITTNSTLQIGQDLAPGSYVLELVQGNKKAEQKVIKVSK